MKIGYARVSMADQKLALQHDALTAAGCEVIHDDKLSGAVRTRPGLTVALNACQAGDVLVVWKLDRLGRTTSELLRLVEEAERAWRRFRGADGQGCRNQHDAAGRETHPGGIRGHCRV